MVEKDHQIERLPVGLTQVHQFDKSEQVHDRGFLVDRDSDDVALVSLSILAPQVCVDVLLPGTFAKRFG